MLGLQLCRSVGNLSTKRVVAAPLERMKLYLHDDAFDVACKISCSGLNDV